MRIDNRVSNPIYIQGNIANMSREVKIMTNSYLLTYDGSTLGPLSAKEWQLQKAPP